MTVWPHVAWLRCRLPAMGFNATRRYRDGKGADIALLAIGLLVLVVLSLWGLGVI